MAVALLAAACGGSPVAPAPEAEAWNAYCLVFGDTTEPLSAHGLDYPTYQQRVADALQPLLEKAFGEEPVGLDDQDLLFALERLGAGVGTPDDLWAVDALGDALVAEGAAGCASLGQNLTAMPAPPPHGWDVPPETHIDSAFPAGSAAAACDVFILTVNSWMDDIANGAQLGPSVAEEADTLRVALQGLGIVAGLDQLRLVGEKWATLSWGPAAEEGYPLLVEAARLLAEAAPRCGDLVEAINYEPEPIAPTTTIGDPSVYWAFDCRTAPPEERTSVSSVPLVLIPDPVTAGSMVALEIGARESRTEDITGSWAQWRCWNGSGWVTTHLLEFGWEYGGRVVPGELGVTWTIGGVGLATPNTFWVTIPNVPPGWYRFVVEGGDYLAVEVIESG